MVSKLWKNTKQTKRLVAELLKTIRMVAINDKKVVVKHLLFILLGVALIMVHFLLNLLGAIGICYMVLAEVIRLKKFIFRMIAMSSTRRILEIQKNIPA